jgi:hypothetical protein
MGFFHGLIPFAKNEYYHNAQHFAPDPRYANGQFSLLNALGQYDGQWYLKIAQDGYPAHPTNTKPSATETLGGMLYNFFPLLSICIAGINLRVHNVEISAFLLTLIVQLGVFVSAYFVSSHWFSEKIAAKTTLLMTLFPFSIYLRGYYNEGLRLLLFIWLCYCIDKKKYGYAAVLLGLSCVASGVSLLLLPVFLIILLLAYRTHTIQLRNVFLYLIISGMPFLFWVLFCYFQTKDPFFFLFAMSSWVKPYSIPILQNIKLLFTFLWLPMRGFHGSQIDEFVIVVTLITAYYARKILPRTIWWLTCVLAITPLLVQDSVSYARFAIVLFPFFVVAARKIRQRYFVLTLVGFGIALLIISLGFINWYWVE